MLQDILLFMTLFSILSSISTSSSSSSSDAQMDDFNDAFLAMLDVYVVDESYNSAYLDYIENFGKSNDYTLDGSDNYAELQSRYLRYIQSDKLVTKWNSIYNKTITVYKTDTNGNVTDEVERTYVYEPYTHTYFSDILDEDRMEYLMDEIYGISYSNHRRLQSISECVCVTKLPNYYYYSFDLSDTYCDSVQNQGQYGTCWAFAATAEAECNYNYENSKTGTNRIKFNECFTTMCTNAGSINGGWSHLAEKYFVNNGICSNYPNSYPTCIAPGSTCQTCSSSFITASDCYSFNIPTEGGLPGYSSARNNFLAANRQLSNHKHAMTFNFNVGSNNSPFFHLKGDAPTDYVCDTGKNWHAMTIQGTSIQWDKNWGTLKVKNSWGTGWGDNGYFHMSVENFESCSGYSIDWNVFKDQVPYPGFRRCDSDLRASAAGTTGKLGTSESSESSDEIRTIPPSYIPSDIPSYIPSDIPTDIPTDIPSDIPSYIPSDMPSFIPSSSPIKTASTTTTAPHTTAATDTTAATSPTLPRRRLPELPCRNDAQVCCATLWDDVISNEWNNTILDVKSGRIGWIEECIQDICLLTYNAYRLPCNATDFVFNLSTYRILRTASFVQEENDDKQDKFIIYDLGISVSVLLKALLVLIIVVMSMFNSISLWMWMKQE